MDASVDDMEAGRGVVPEKNEAIVLNMVPASKIEQMFSFAMLPPSSEVRRREGPGSDQIDQLPEVDHALSSYAAIQQQRLPTSGYRNMPTSR
jgi:hypothetical protein